MSEKHKLINLGNPPWTRKEMLDSLPAFAEFYQDRPFADNTGGMKAPHMFAVWFALQKLKPKAIIESGVWYGQGTWLFEKICPEAQVICIDPNLERIRYRPATAQYFSQDFSTIDWNHLPKAETLVFIDDHQNAYERIRQAKWFGFRHLMFEDNYPAGVGDCYSLKKAFMHSGFTPISNFRTKIKSFLQNPLSFSSKEERSVLPNKVDAACLYENLQTYYEFPPVYKPDKTRWGAIWDSTLPTPDALLDTIDQSWQKIFKEEAKDYTWICYAELK